MDDPQALRLTLPDWLVLCLVAEQPRHGWALAELLSPKAKSAESGWSISPTSTGPFSGLNHQACSGR